MQPLYQPEGFYGDGRGIGADGKQSFKGIGEKGLYHPGRLEDKLYECEE